VHINVGSKEKKLCVIAWSMGLIYSAVKHSTAFCSVVRKK